MRELTHATAVELTAWMRTGQVSVAEVMQAHLTAIETWNPVVNAVVDVQAEQALERARSLDARRDSAPPSGLLWGLPVAHKDLAPAAGFRFTQGSALFADRVAADDATIVARIRAEGAICVGKTNVPEFGLGSHTFNDVYGLTRNPYDPSRSAGGSSGGAAAALAARMLPLADGSDTGGSLRNPASFCGVVGLRPSPGRVPSWPEPFPGGQLSVKGPMGRTVADVALLLSAMSGWDAARPWPAAPSSHPGRGASSRRRVAWSADLGGLVPVERELREVLESAVVALATDLGWELVETAPDLSAAVEAFRVLRAWQLEATLGALEQAYGEAMKPDARWNIRAGRELSGPRVGAAVRTVGMLREQLAVLFDDVDLVLTPACQVLPFPVGQRYPRSVDGVPMTDYLEWMTLPSAISAVGNPALSLPVATTPGGLPVGLQVVGPYGREDLLLAGAAELEGASSPIPPPQLPSQHFDPFEAVR